MEKLFDIATQAELIKLFGKTGFAGDEEPFATERRLMAENRNAHLACLADLFLMRGDLQKAEACADSITNAEERLAARMFLFECQIA
jgi:hypothetical protein